jgi:PadR family transcriptional regulator PadR
MADVLGTFEQAVLLAVMRLGDDAYGRTILKDVESRLGRAVAAGAVHATLVRLERKGLVASSLGTGTAVGGGPARRL